jgi:hypothetical protein
MFCQKAQVGEVVGNKEHAINEGKDKTGLDEPGKVQFKLGCDQFLFDLGILFQGKLFCFFGSGRFFYHMGNSISLAENGCNKKGF